MEIENEKKIIAYILKDAKNQPFIKIIYNFGEGFCWGNELRPNEITKAQHIFRNMNDKDGFVKYDPNSEVFFSNMDLNPQRSPAYITGSEPGSELCIDLIKEISSALVKQPSLMPFYVCKGKVSVLYNQAEFKRDEILSANSNHEFTQEELKYFALETASMRKKLDEMLSSVPDERTDR